MAYKMTKVEFCSWNKEEIMEFICDTDDDFANLPTCATGSTAVSVESGTIKIVNASGQWVTFGG